MGAPAKERCMDDQKNERQDPAEPKRVDTAVETEKQPEPAEGLTHEPAEENVTTEKKVVTEERTETDRSS